MATQTINAAETRGIGGLSDVNCGGSCPPNKFYDSTGTFTAGLYIGYAENCYYDTWPYLCYYGFLYLYRNISRFNIPSGINITAGELRFNVSARAYSGFGGTVENYTLVVDKNNGIYPHDPITTSDYDVSKYNAVASSPTTFQLTSTGSKAITLSALAIEYLNSRVGLTAGFQFRGDDHWASSDPAQFDYVTADNFQLYLTYNAVGSAGAIGGGIPYEKVLEMEREWLDYIKKHTPPFVWPIEMRGMIKDVVETTITDLRPAMIDKKINEINKTLLKIENDERRYRRLVQQGKLLPDEILSYLDKQRNELKSELAKYIEERKLYKDRVVKWDDLVV